MNESQQAGSNTMAFTSLSFFIYCHLSKPPRCFIPATPNRTGGVSPTLPEPSASACFCLNLLSMSVASNPALSHSWRGITCSSMKQQQQHQVAAATAPSGSHGSSLSQSWCELHQLTTPSPCTPPPCPFVQNHTRRCLSLTPLHPLTTLLTSSAFAKALMNSCDLPGIERA